MNYDQTGLQPLLRVVFDRPDWPQSGPGWVRVAPSHDPMDIDCVVVTHEGPVAALAGHGVPMLVAPDAETPLGLVDAGRELVFEDDQPETIAALLRRACRVETPGLRERGDGRELISALSQEAARIADALARLAEDDHDAATETMVDSRLVRRIIRLRRDRDRHFPAEIFADPAWDMLLDLAAARLEGQRVSVSSLCIASAVPTTTALRWVRSLSEAGIFERSTDPMDARRTWIMMSDRASDAMMAWLRRFATQFTPI